MPLDARTFATLAIANPAAGADFSTTVPAGELWQLHSVGGQLVTSGVAANREVALVIDDPTTTPTLAVLPSGTNQTLTETRRYSFIKELGYRGAGSQVPANISVGCGDIIVPGGMRVRVSTINIQVADQWSGCFVTYKKLG